MTAPTAPRVELLEDRAQPSAFTTAFAVGTGRDPTQTALSTVTLFQPSGVGYALPNQPLVITPFDTTTAAFATSAGSATTATTTGAAPSSPTTVPVGPVTTNTPGSFGMAQSGTTTTPAATTTPTTTTATTRYTGGVRPVVADFDGDGAFDMAVATGPGTANRVKVYSGRTGAVVFDRVVFDNFTGGLFLAAGELNLDGKAELIVTPDESGGPRVKIFSGAGVATNDPSLVLADFFGIDDPNFRGGARAAAGDINGDGIDDVVVTAGTGGGPRVAVFSGRTVLAGDVSAAARLVPDFFLFERELRNGFYIAVGDVDGDGRADLVGGGGPGGGPRVLVVNGRTLLERGSVAALATPIADFFGGDPALRGGIRVAVKNLDGDARADIVTGAGDGAGSRVAAFLGARLVAGLTTQRVLDFDAFSGYQYGIYVG